MGFRPGFFGTLPFRVLPDFIDAVHFGLLMIQCGMHILLNLSQRGVAQDRCECW